MDFLARREHSYFELQQKLLTRFDDASPELVDEVLSRLREENLQSDDRFTESYVRYRKSKKFGYLHIKKDLGSRRVRDSVISKYLFADDGDWRSIVKTLIDKRIGPEGKLGFASKEHRKLLRFLTGRGFDAAMVKDLVKARIE